MNALCCDARLGAHDVESTRSIERHDSIEECVDGGIEAARCLYVTAQLGPGRKAVLTCDDALRLRQLQLVAWSDRGRDAIDGRAISAQKRLPQ